jgi:hypothetical protein
MLALALLVAILPAVSESKPPPPKPKPPQLELLTQSQDAALRQSRLKLAVESKHGRYATVDAELVVEGIPEDYRFKLGPKRERLRQDEAKIRMQLSQRQREVLAFGEQACMRADVNAQAKVGKRVRTIHKSLRKSAGC